MATATNLLSTHGDATERISEVSKSLQSMGYSENYILRAISVHKRSKRGNNFDLSLLIEIINRLQHKDKKHAQIIPFQPHLSSIEALQLNVNDFVDYRFENGRFVLCKIIKKTINLYKHYVILLHPLGIDDKVTKHNRLCDLYLSYHKLAKPRSISLRKCDHYGFNLDDYVDINPGKIGWKYGRIIKKDIHSSQYKVLHYNVQQNRHESSWFHIENIEEMAPFKSKCKQMMDPSSFNINVKQIDLQSDENEDHDQTPNLPPSPPSFPMANISFDEHEQKFNVFSLNSSISSSPNTPKYSMDSHRSYATCTNTIMCDPKFWMSVHHDHNNKTNEIVGQLLSFGYGQKEIDIAMKQVNNPSNINEIIEFMTKHDMHQFIDSVSTPSISHSDDESAESKSDILSSPKPTPRTPPSNAHVFGVQSILLQSTLVPDTDYGYPIPDILIQLKQNIFQQHGHLSKDIFRQNSLKVTTECDKIIQNLNDNQYDPLSLAELIKLWFKNLPQSIFNDVDTEKILKCKNMQIAGEIIENDMGEPFESLYKWLLDLCVEITKYESQNKMNIKKLAVAITPYLFDTDQVSTSQIKFVQLSIIWRHFQSQ